MFVKSCFPLRDRFKHAWKPLFPQLSLRVGVEKQHPPRQSAHRNLDILRKYGPDYKVIFVGDAMMAPYEITHVGGSVEHWNDEPGAVWMQRMADHFSKLVWLNPASPERLLGQGGSLGLIRDIVHRKCTL